MRKEAGILFLVMAIVLSLGLVAGCSTGEKTEDEAPATTQSASEAESAAAENEAVGYGAAGARADEGTTMEEMLVYAIQDEYLARAEYIHVLGAFGDQSPFNNILVAEEQHIDALEALFEKYQLPFPPDLADEYVIVPASVTEALGVGVQAEINNIAMYESFLGQELPDDVRNTFTSLKNASESHLQAFQRSLDRKS